MKKLLCAAAAAVFAVPCVLLVGCGYNNEQQPGYVIEETEPDIENEEYGFYIVNSTELMITEYYGSDTDVEIPETYDGYTITSIGAYAFSEKDIVTLTMPDTVKEIESYAFFKSKSLVSVHLSESLETLGDNVFFLCTSLKEINIPASVTDLGMYTFTGSGIESVEIPEGNLESIGYYVFYECMSLKEITFPSTVTFIEEEAISGNENTVTVKAPSGSYVEEYVEEHAEEYNLVFEATDSAE